MTYICVTNDAGMKKKEPIKKTKNYKPPQPISKMEEPSPVYNKSVKVTPSLKDFTYSEFKRISDKTPFTQAEWAGMLHISERTLQRYAKSNSNFAPINAERALQIGNVLKKAKEIFGSLDVFYNWLKQKPQMLEGSLSLESLTTASGIAMILTQLGRLEHGILA